MSEAPIRRVTVIGLGVIGGSMARRLLDSGYDVTVYNRSPEKVAKLTALGAKSAPTPAEAAAASELTIVAITDDAAVLEAILGPSGVGPGARSGSVVVDSSTVSPETERQIARTLERRGVGYLDAPVTGGAEAARKGTLTLLCGGAESVFERARPVLVTVGSRVLHMGPTGAGQLTKAINQVILAGSLLGVAEGMTLAKASGMDLEKVIEALKDGAGSSWVLSNRAIFMARGEYPPVGRLALHLKDLNIALQVALEAGVGLGGATMVRDLEKQLASSGRGDYDISAIVLALEPDPNAAKR
jgi:3-hydroxyisobutyrate dehydrogenase